MMDLFQDRRIFVNSKKKPLTKNVLPEIKYSPTIPKKMNDDILFPTANSRLLYNYQPLSNFLISKKITPPNPQQMTLLISKKRPTAHANIHHLRLMKESMKRISDKQTDDNPEEKRNSTSLSHRVRHKEYYNEETSFEELKINKSIKIDELTFAVVKGNNNQDLVRQIMGDRKAWKQVKFGEAVPNFKWVFYKDKLNYKKMFSYNKKRAINHFEFNEEISTKDCLIRNLQIYCQTKKIEVFTITPITFILDFDDEYCEYNMKQFLSFFQKNDPRKNPPKKSVLPLNFVSKFTGYMAWQNSDIKKKVNILSKPVNNSTYYSQNSYLWLLKPTGLNRGRGIEIFDSVEQLEKILLDYLLLMNRKKFKERGQEKEKEKEKGEKNQKDKSEKNQQKHDKTQQKDKAEKQSKQSKQSEKQKISQSKELDGECSTTPEPKFSGQKFKLNTCSFVIQKYVQKPFLIHNRKFDIRVWVLLTESLNIYFFKQGYIRTSTQIFCTDNIDNYFIHLTNNAIQKYSENYGQFENANQLSFWDLKQFMSEQETEQIWARIKEISFMTFSSVKKKINANNRKHCFQIFGLDFIIDSEKKVWLIEVNENPCIECSSPLLGQLIPRMLNDAFKLTIDHIFERKGEEKAYPVKGYTDTENMWQNLGQLLPNGDYSLRNQNK